MNSVLKKVSPIRPLPYKVIVYCPRCTARRLIDLQDYPDYSLDDIHLRMQCRSCNAVGMDFSIVHSGDESGD